MREFSFPRVRSDDPTVSVRELAGEFVIYDAARSRAHALNPSVASVWRLCDGTTPFEEIVEAIAELYDLKREDARSIVLMSLQRLERAHLLSEPWPDVQLPVPTRREALQTMAKIGGAALLPVIHSLAAPHPAQAQSVVNCSQYSCHPSQGVNCPQGCRCSKPRGLGQCLPA
jgi:hypothetical protein